MHPLLEQVKEVSKKRMQKLAMALEFMPKENLMWRLPECDKTPLELYLECGGAFLMTARLLRGEKPDPNLQVRDMLPEAEEFPDLEGAKAMMKRFQEEFFDALENLDESKLDQVMSLPSGDKTTLAKLLMGPAMKACHSCGQLKFYESLLESRTASTML